MEENEVVESTESGAPEGSSSEASGSDSSGAAQAQAGAAEQKQDTTPFHEHPRFKELVEQKNSYQGKFQDMESRYKALESQLNSFKESQPKPQTESDSLLKDLEKVDPRLANAIGKALKAVEIAEANKSEFEKYQKSSQEREANQAFSTAVGKVNALHESNKMSDFGKKFIDAQLNVAVRTGQLNYYDLKAVENAYTENLKSIKAYEDSMKRDVTQSYVQSKKTDAAVPASVPKGPQAKPAAKATPSFKNKDDLRSAVVKSYLKEAAAAKDAANS